MASEVIGRDDELELLSAFFERRDLTEPRALVLEGEAGIGKSTLWLQGLDLSRQRGFRVLSCRPAEAEQDLTFAGLGDVLEGCLDDVLPLLPPPRRRALEVALLIAPTEGALDPRALGVAVRSAFELLSETQPLLLAVDDVQWLDGPSADTFAFVLRRMTSPLHVLYARRLGEHSRAKEIASLLAASSVDRVEVGPMSAGALQAITRARVARVFPRPTLLRIHEMSGGNPFYALEIARALPRDPDPSLPLAVPETLDELVRARISAMPAASRRALVLLSAVGEANSATLRKAGAEEALEAAVSHGIVERAGERLRFTHPLLASGVYQAADGPTRRSCHAVLAELVDDPLESAHHRALATEGRDAKVAELLEQAATEASVRGAPTVAAKLGDLARRLTSDNDVGGRHRRAILAAIAYLRAGDVQRARSLAEEALAEASDDAARAEALVLMSAVEAATGDRARAVELRREALSISDSHPSLQAAVHQWLAANLPDSESVGVKQRHARASLELAESLDDDILCAGALAVLAELLFEAGEPEAIALAERAHALATAHTAQSTRPAPELAHLLAWTYDRIDLIATFVLVDLVSTVGRHDTARALLDDLVGALADKDELLQSKTFWIRALIELDAGRWALARDLAEREREIAALYGHADPWEGPFVVAAQLALHRGELDAAHELAVRARVVATTSPGSMANAEATLGLVDRAGGDTAGAIARFSAAEAAADACGWREPSLLWWRADFAEALLEVGRVDDAVLLLDAWEPDARRLGRDRELAYATRCRGMVAAARGDVDLALTTLEEAVDGVDAVNDPVGRARALLALGVTRRRARQKRGAREALEAALAEFEQLGDAPRAARVRAELGQIGGRSREEGLTAAERRVAALVAEGKTNREVAASLVLGERTVETHLTHVYAKLGVRSRTELARVYEPEA